MELCNACTGCWITCPYGDEYRETGECSHFKEDDLIEEE